VADKAEKADGQPPKKSKKMLFIIVGAVVALAAAGGGFFFIQSKKAAEADGEAETSAKHEVKAPPTFMPLENMVVNLADPAGDRYVQIGITLEVTDPHAVDTIKAFMPSIRNGILLAVSKHTAADLLQLEGKEQLAADIKAEVSKPLGFDEAEHEAEAEPEKPKAGAKNAKTKAKAKKKGPVNPVQRVLFSSFIVQ